MPVVVGDKMLDFLKNKDETKSIDRDIGLVQDTFGFLCDMTAYESHCLNHFISTGDVKELEDMAWMRKKRTYYLDLISKCEGNSWCQNKHLLRIAMGLQEDCSRFLSIGDIEKAKKCAEDYAEVYMKFLETNGYTIEDLKNGGSSA